MYNANVDHLSPQNRSWNMSRIRSRNTAPEKTVRKFLSENGLRYRLHSSTLPGKPDIVFKSRKVAIFVNGCFWHKHKNCKRSTIPKSKQEYWLPKLQRNASKQKGDLRKLKKAGWRTIIIWECQTKKAHNIKKVFNKVNE